MYVGVDIGGTKTLLAVLDEHGVIIEKKKFPTPKTYDNFLLELKHAVPHLENIDFKAGAIAIPGNVDRRHGRGIQLGNLSWKNFNIQHDTEKIFNCPIIVENDAKMAGLSEAMLLKDKFSKVVYVTISTGIGYALVVNGKIDTSIGDAGGRGLMLEHQGKLMAWEDFAGGRAIVERYGKLAKDINDDDIWKEISRYLTQGLIEIIAVTQPEVIVFGGGVGTSFKKYAQHLEAEFKQYDLPMIKIPELVQAKRPEEAVLFGCYDLAKQRFGHA